MRTLEPKDLDALWKMRGNFLFRKIHLNKHFPGAEANGLREHLRGADERYSSRLEYD